MLPFSSLSRRALVAAAALAAVVPSAAAKKKPKPKPPLAFAWVILTNVSVDVAGPEPLLIWAFKAAYLHPATGEPGSLSSSGHAAVPTTAKAARAAITAWIAMAVSASLAMDGIAVPADRIEVVLL